MRCYKVLSSNHTFSSIQGTHKLKKVDLAKEGFCPSIVKDRLYYLNSKTQQYESLTEQIYNDIMSGKIRL